MQTNFAPAALDDAHMQASEKILRSCVHCGFCTATCPTYLLLGDELDSPRGRIYLIKEMLESGKPATAEVVKHVDRCLSCLSCMTTCPSGVHYMHLVDHARAYIEETYQRPLADRLMRRVLAFILPYPARFRIAIILAGLARPLRGLFARVPVVGQRLAAMLALAPKSLPTRSAFEGPAEFVPEFVPEFAPEFTLPPAAAKNPARRVALLSGCAQSVLDPAINEATIALLNRHNIAVVLPKGEGCCGALVHHMGREQDAHAFAKANIDAWWREYEGAGLDAIITTTSGCGTTLKDYGFMLREDGAYAEKAAKISSLVKDVSEFLATLPLQFRPLEKPLTLAYHPACSLQHGQKIVDAPKKLLRDAGFVVKEIAESHICCGSAGVYNILQPEIAGQLRARKQGNIARLKVDAVVAGNIGCITQIGLGFDMPVVHLVQMLNWASGGEKPAILEKSSKPS